MNKTIRNPLPTTLGVLLLSVLVSNLTPARAEQAATRAAINAGTVSVLTDGLSTSTGRGAKAMLSMARAVSNVGELRVLAIAGEGGFQNLRDLLFLKGVDFAVLNSDVLTHQELFGPYRIARSQTKLVAKLFDQRIVLFARAGIGDIRDLEGKAVGFLGKDGPGRLSAETIFRLLGIKVRLVGIGPTKAGDEDGTKQVDAILALEEQLANEVVKRESLAAFTPLAIPMTPELAKTYERARLEHSFPYGRSSGQDIATLRSATVLAVFNWPSTAGRYGNVIKFIEALFKEIVALRQSPDGELWQQAAPTEAVPGWDRYGPAVASRWLDQKEVTRVATVAPTRLVEAPQPVSAGRALSGPDSAGEGVGALRALVVERPPFHGRQLEDGGILTALLRNVLAETGGEVQVDWAEGGAEVALQALGQARHDVFLSSEAIECNQPSGLTRAAAFLCDETTATSAFMPVVIGLFVGKDSTLTALGRESEDALTVCLANGRPAGRLGAVKSRPVKIVRQDSLALCVGLVQSGAADAFVANELEGRFLIRRLGIASEFRMLEEPLETRSMHARVVNNRPGAAALLARINEGLKRIKQTDVYGAVVRDHVMAIWGGQRAVNR